MRRVVKSVKPLALVCDEPAEGAHVGLGTVVEGWAFSPAGVKEVSVWLDGERVARAELGLERPDVAREHPEWSGAERSGFRCRFEAVPAAASTRTAELVIVAEDGEGREAEVRRAIRPVEQVLVCDEPAEGADVGFGTVVSGWAFSPAGVRGVSVWLDGQRVGDAELGLERPDVAREHPEWSGAERSGFRCRFETTLTPPLPRTAGLAVVAEDGEGRRVEERRMVQAVEESPPPPMAGSLDIPMVRQPQDPASEAGWASPLVVYGWAVDTEGVDRIDVLLDGQVVAQAEYGLPREDVEVLQRAYRRLGLANRSGWLAVIPTEGFGPGQHTVSATLHGHSGALPLGSTTVSLLAENVRADPDRQRRLEAILRCPACGHELVRDEAGLVCSGCGRTIRSSEFGTLLFEETYADLDWRQTGVSSRHYPPGAAEVIAECREGLVLEIGAGMRENLPHVIQLDAIAYPTTDVSANGEALPFADESFDAVVACALLEHVSEPAAVVSEMRRVCKKGGRIYADCTSVHPYHGFPHHYFNATETGLDWLMREVGGATGTVMVADARATIALVLEAWLGSLEDPGTRDSVEKLPVGDLIAILKHPDRHDPDLYAALDNVFANGRRLVPPKVMFSGIRTR
jgi:SAM-dependent methyltransferase